MTIRIVLVDDHHVVRTGLRAILEAEADFDVVGEADTGSDGVRLAQEVRPDVVLTDLLLPDLDGIGVTQRIRAQLPATRVVILTSVSNQDQWVVRAIGAGAASCVVKSADVAELVQTIRQAAQGQVSISSQVAAWLMRDLQSPRHATLTNREQDVLRNIADGRTDKEIGRSLNITLSTVKSHVRSILDKLGVESRTQAALYAVRTQMIFSDGVDAAA